MHQRGSKVLAGVLLAKEGQLNTLHFRDSIADSPLLRGEEGGDEPSLRVQQMRAWGCSSAMQLKERFLK